jgi:hypothetical protein
MEASREVGTTKGHLPACRRKLASHPTPEERTIAVILAVLRLLETIAAVCALAVLLLLASLASLVGLALKR